MMSRYGIQIHSPVDNSLLIDNNMAQLLYVGKATKTQAVQYVDSTQGGATWGGVVGSVSGMLENWVLPPFFDSTTSHMEHSPVIFVELPERTYCKFEGIYLNAFNSVSVMFVLPVGYEVLNVYAFTTLDKVGPHSDQYGIRLYGSDNADVLTFDSGWADRLCKVKELLTINTSADINTAYPDNKVDRPAFIIRSVATKCMTSYWKSGGSTGTAYNLFEKYFGWELDMNSNQSYKLKSLLSRVVRNRLEWYGPPGVLPPGLGGPQSFYGPKTDTTSDYPQVFAVVEASDYDTLDELTR